MLNPVHFSLRSLSNLDALDRVLFQYVVLVVFRMEYFSIKVRAVHRHIVVISGVTCVDLDPICDQVARMDLNVQYSQLT